MTVVVTLEDYRPSPRYDGLPWTDAQIQESALSTGPWVTLETQALTPVDADPENPAYRNFTTALGTAALQWYRIVFLDAALATGLPTFPIQNVEDDRPIYAPVSDLALLLNVDATARHNSLMRVLKSASDEIDSEIGGAADINGDTIPYSNPPSIARSVCLDRAVEHWRQEHSPFGLVNMGEVAGAMYVSRDTWDRHAQQARDPRRAPGGSLDLRPADSVECRSRADARGDPGGACGACGCRDESPVHADAPGCERHAGQPDTAVHRCVPVRG